MTGRIRTSLTRHQPKNPLDNLEIEKMAKAIWLMKGKLFIDPDTISDDFDRQHLINIGNKKYGEKHKNEK